MDEQHLEIRSMSGDVLASHRMAPAGAGALRRAEGHRVALEEEILQGFSTKPPCQRKRNRPPSEAAKQIAAGIGAPATSFDVDLSYYEELAR